MINSVITAAKQAGQLIQDIRSRPFDVEQKGKDGPVTEADGKVTDLFGEPLRFNQPFPKTKGVLAGAPEVYERALTEIREIGASDRMAEMEGR